MQKHHARILAWALVERLPMQLSSAREGLLPLFSLPSSLCTAKKKPAFVPPQKNQSLCLQRGGGALS